MTQKSTDLRSRTPQGVAGDIRSAWEDDANERAIPIIPRPRPSDDTPRIPQQPRQEQARAVAA
jgi:hypothetical protein